MDKYFMYLRKSRKDIEAEMHGEGETLARHEKILTDLYRSMGILDNQVTIFKEIVSGESIASRPVIQKILLLVEQQIYVGGFVVEVERLARGNTFDQGIISNTFQYSNTKIITPLKTYDPCNEYDQEYFEFGLFMSRREYNTINRRLQTGRLVSAKEGKFTGSRPAYGYNKVKLQNQKGYTLEINKEQSTIVKLIFEMYVCDRKTPQYICNHLNTLSIPAPKNDVWTVSGVREILRNPVYAGFIVYNEHVTTKQVKNGQIVKSRQTNNGEIKELVYVKGLHEAIISIELYNQSVELRRSKDVSPLNKNYTLQNPLSGLLMCKLCSKPLTRYTMRGTKRVYCKTYNCKNVSNSLQEIEDRVLDTLKIWLGDKKLYTSTNSKQTTLDLKKEMLNKVSIQLKKAIKKREHIYDLFEEEIYNKDMFVERSEKIKTIIGDLEKQINILKSEIKEIEENEFKKEIFIPKLKYLLANYNNINSAKEKNILLKEVIDKIYYLKKKQGNKWHSSDFELWIFPKLPRA